MLVVTVNKPEFREGWTMDPELAAASVLLERVDVADHVAARINMNALKTTESSAVELTAGRVDVHDRVIRTGADRPDIPIRVYEPRPRPALPVPVVVFIHGGAFVMGDLDSEHARCLRYAADGGCVVVSVDYRLAPEHPFPAGLEDCYRALEWCVDEAEALGIDPRRIAIAGASAGAALATCVAQYARDHQGPSITLQLLICPVIDDRMDSPSMQTFKHTPVWDSANNRSMWIQYGGGQPPSAPYAVPSRQALTGLPTTCMLIAGFDPLRDQALDYARGLLAAGVHTEVHLVAAAYHGFDQVVPDAEISRRAIDEQVHWLMQFLRP